MPDNQRCQIEKGNSSIAPNPGQIQSMESGNKHSYMFQVSALLRKRKCQLWNSMHGDWVMHRGSYGLPLAKMEESMKVHAPIHMQSYDTSPQCVCLLSFCHILYQRLILHLTVGRLYRYILQISSELIIILFKKIIIHQLLLTLSYKIKFNLKVDTCDQDNNYQLLHLKTITMYTRKAYT